MYTASSLKETKQGRGGGGGGGGGGRSQKKKPQIPACDLSDNTICEGMFSFLDCDRCHALLFVVTCRKRTPHYLPSWSGSKLNMCAHNAVYWRCARE